MDKRKTVASEMKRNEEMEIQRKRDILKSQFAVEEFVKVQKEMDKGRESRNIQVIEIQYDS